MPGLTHTAFPPTRSRRPSPRLTAPRRFILRACTSCIRSGSAPRGSFCSRPGHSRGAGLDNPVVMEVVNHYPVDGVQFDDYFYTETPGPLNDASTFRRYGEGFSSKADWRRHNTQQLIVQVSVAIKQAKPEVEFGVSPAGSGAIAPSTRQARTRAAPQPMMNPTLTRANGYSRVYWITLRRRSTGPSPATRHVTMC